MAERERRSIAGTVERVDGDPRTLQGYAAVFNQRTEIMGLFEERIAPGAFAAAIGRDDVRALFNHDPNYVLGRTSAGTLRLSEDARGLAYSIDPPDTQAGRDVSALIARGDVQGSSFSFEIEEESWDRSGALPLRTIMRAKLHDVGPVTFPAYEQTTVSARCISEGAHRGAETLSRERSRWTLAAKA
jgi:HK97 family phage prohead protease